MSRLLRIKPMSMLSEEAREEGEHTLKRSLGALNLVTLGVGAVIGAGIFTLTGQAAALRAGPAVALSFVLAGLTCAFAGLCYAEFASIIPIAGSAYTYGYATLGELVAWIIGWDLCLEYAFGASTVASGWAGYFNSLLQQFHIYIPPQLTATTGTPLVFYHEQWLQVMSLPPGVSAEGLPHATGVFNLIAVCIVMVITTILVIGIKESANFNSAIVIIKVTIVCIFLVVGGYFLFQHPAVASANWHPFVPPPDWARQLRVARHTHGSGVDLLRLYWLRRGLNGSPGGEESAARHADRDSRLAGGLHDSLHSGFAGAHGAGELQDSECVGSGGSRNRRYGSRMGIAAGEDRRGLRSGHGDAGHAAGSDARLLFDVEGWTAAQVGFGRASQVPHAVDHDHCFRRVCCDHAGVSAHRETLGTGQYRNAAGFHDCECGRVGVARASPRNEAAVQDAAGAAGADSRAFFPPLYLMSRLARITWIVMIVWLLIGLIIYFSYSVKHSKVQRLPVAVEGD